MIGLVGVNNGGLNGDVEEISLHRLLTLAATHDEQKLPLVRSCRRWVLIIILMIRFDRREELHPAENIEINHSIIFK